MRERGKMMDFRDIIMVAILVLVLWLLIALVLT
jgi:hypothetical protein